MLQSMGSQRIGHDWVTELDLSRVRMGEEEPWAPLEVRMCMANYAKYPEKLLEFQRMNGPLEWGCIRRSVGHRSFHEEVNDLCSKDREV